MSMVFYKENPLVFLGPDGESVDLESYLTGAGTMTFVSGEFNPSSDGWLCCEYGEELCKKIFEEARDRQLLPNIVFDAGLSYEKKVEIILAKCVTNNSRFIVCSEDMTSFYCENQSIREYALVASGFGKPVWFDSYCEALKHAAKLSNLIGGKATGWRVMESGAAITAMANKIGLKGAGPEVCENCDGCHNNCSAAF